MSLPKLTSLYEAETAEYLIGYFKEESENPHTTQNAVFVSLIVHNIYKLLADKSINEIRITKPSGDIQLKMQFRGQRRDLIEIYCLSTLSKEMKLSFKHLLKNGTIQESSYKFEANKWIYLIALFKLEDDTLINKNALKLDTENGKLKLNFSFSFINNPKQPNQDTVLTDLMTNLLNDGTFFDVIVKSNEGEEYKCHKAVLRSRSDVLKVHFENFDTHIVESPFETKIVHEVLKYIYTNEVNIDEIPERLLVAADYYHLNVLKELCESALHKKLTIENVIETLELAELYSANTLKQRSLNFIKNNDGEFKLITKSEGWAKLKSVDLLKGICEHIAADDDDDDDN